MDPALGYGEDEYYNPKQTHYKIMYRGRAKGGLPEDNLVDPDKDDAPPPADNLIHTRTGEKLPYWVDAYYRLKQSETRSMQPERKRKAETGSKGNGKKKKGPAGGGASSKKRERVGDPIVSIDNVYIFSLSPAAEEHEEGEKKGTVTVTSCMLKSNPSEKLNTDLSDIFAVLDGGKDAQIRPIMPLSTVASGTKTAPKKKKVVTFEPAVVVSAVAPAPVPLVPSVVFAPSVPISPQPVSSAAAPQIDLMYLKRRRGEYNAHQIAQYDAGNRNGTYQLMMNAGLDPDDVLIDFCKFLCAK